MCSCTITKPGVTVLPARSKISAPSGMVTLPSSPMARIEPLWMTRVWPERAGAPVPSMTRALRRATVGALSATKALTSSDSPENPSAAAGALASGRAASSPAAAPSFVALSPDLAAPSSAALWPAGWLAGSFFASCPRPEQATRATAIAAMSTVAMRAMVSLACTMVAHHTPRCRGAGIHARLTRWIRRPSLSPEL